MYNEFAPKHYKGKWPCTTKTLYNEKTLTGRLHKYFLIYFETFSAPTADTLFLLVLSILTLESVHSIRFLYQHFLSGITTKSLNTFYHACSYAKVDYSHFMNITAKVALRMFQNSLTMLHIMVPIIWMDTACKYYALHTCMEEWQDEIYSAVFVLVPVEYWNKLLWAENLLVTLQLYGTKLQGYWNAGKSDQYLLLCNEDLTLSGWAVFRIPYKKCTGVSFWIKSGHSQPDIFDQFR